jgi:hypothetical protein
MDLRKLIRYAVYWLPSTINGQIIFDLGHLISYWDRRLAEKVHSNPTWKWLRWLVLSLTPQQVECIYQWDQFQVGALSWRAVHWTNSYIFSAVPLLPSIITLNPKVPNQLFWIVVLRNTHSWIWRHQISYHLHLLWICCSYLKVEIYRGSAYFLNVNAVIFCSLIKS